MNTKFIPAILLIIGIAIGYVVGSNTAANTDSMSDGDMEMDMNMDMDMSQSGTHTHRMLEIDQGQPIPTIELEVSKDMMDGYNLHLVTTNFTFTPETVNEKNVANTGHAHIWVNGVKLSRLYGNWFNLSSKHLNDGENLVEVTLNANDHGEWAVNGQHISDTVTITK